MQTDDLSNTLPDVAVPLELDSFSSAAPAEENSEPQAQKEAKKAANDTGTDTDTEALNLELTDAPPAQLADVDVEPSDTDSLDEPAMANTAPLDLIELQSCLEALLFMADRPLSFNQLRDWVGSNFTADLFHTALNILKERYQAPHHGMELIEVAGGFQLRTKIGRANLAQKLVKTQTQRLSAGAMETLAIISYKQPAMKEDIDQVRGVDSSYFIRYLMEKKLIQISGRSELPGRPLLYSTTTEFLEIFGLKDLSALPSLNELSQMVPASEAGNPEDESPETREMRKLVNAMTTDRTSALYFNPAEDEKILKEIRDRVNQISTTTPYLDELKQNEKALAIAQEEAKTQAELTE